MKIQDMFKKRIGRNIQGVIKVGQHEEENIYQELDEYVVTDELSHHFDEFFDAYKKGIVGRTDKMGVWISGFFGSGKSHFLKILSYLLKNKEVHEKKAIHYFDDKIQDPMVLADMKQAGDVTTDVILFNIDAKSESDSKLYKDSILKVFNKVFNEMQGFCGSIPWVADLERQLQKDEVYDDFKSTFQKISGETWLNAREDFYYEEDAIIEALAQSTKMSEESARNWYNKSEENYHISIEGFAKRVSEYIESRGKNHHVVFLVDEVGQYIGDDSQLMLNLQTVVEELGSHCGGKCWVLVTSQQEIDSVTKVKGQDFSKIQGRFNTRLSRSSANVDEVIRKRILQKDETAEQTLSLLYPKKQSIINNLILFKDTAEMKTFQNVDDFVGVYPFIPYQFNLLQKVFTGIRIHGAAGKHLAEGERSLLSAFQESAIAYADQEVGALVPFSAFYDTVEEFLDASIRSVIIHARQNSRLNPFDVEVLQTLFLIKYVKEIPANLDNLATLLVKHIDDDKIELKKKIEASLHRLVRETLIQRNGEEYIFLTNDEQDVNREIKEIHIDPGEVIQQIGLMVFEDIYKDRKFQYSTRYPFAFNALIDDRTIRSQRGEFGIKIITPAFDASEELHEQELKMMTMRENNVIVKLPVDSTFIDEMEQTMKIESYLRMKSGVTSTQTVDDIKRSKQREITERKQRVHDLLIEGLKEAEIYANSQKLDIKTKNPIDRINEAMRTLVNALYNKLSYVTDHIDTTKELHDLITDSDNQLSLFDEDPNKRALGELNKYIEQNSQRNLTVTMKSLTNHFLNAPFGWKELDVAGLVLKLFTGQEIKLQLNQAYVHPSDQEVVNYVTKRNYVERLVIKKREKTPKRYVENVKNLSKELFQVSALPNDEDGLMNKFKGLLKDELDNIKDLLREYRDRNYPGKDVLTDGKAAFEGILSTEDTLDAYKKAFQLKDDLLDYAEDVVDVKEFFKNQKAIFDKAAEKLAIYEHNETYVLDEKILNIVENIRKIVRNQHPYSEIHLLPELSNEFAEKFTELLEKECEPVRQVIKSDYQMVVDELNKHSFKDELFDDFKAKFDHMLDRIDRVNNFYEAIAMKEESDRVKSRCFNKIDEVEKNQLEKQAPKHVPIGNSGLNGGEGLASGGSKAPYKPRTTVNVSMTNLLHGAKTFEKEEDIDEFLDQLREKLKGELKYDTIIRLI